jgi:hypothetical protein
MSNARIVILALSALTAASALAVGTQTPSDVHKDKTSYNGFVNQELTAAVNSADKASNAKDVTAVHQNLREVINCLAGQGQPGYDASVQDPCRRMGRGALVDLTPDSDEHRLVTQAFNEAKNGLAANTVDSAHDLASKALNDLENAQKDTEQ